ncbi:DMT family transporter [Pseudonocardia sp. NPDC049635]|uniref:DMT family transporter n=1 Tax=Pseudonocardia sp. NPDC049635 TaxID=3155506 RepID=UPI0033D97C75
MSRTSAGRMGATTYLVPAIVIMLSWMLLGELPSWLALIGGVLCLAGVAVTRSRPRTAAAGGPAPISGTCGGERPGAPRIVCFPHAGGRAARMLG